MPSVLLGVRCGRIGGCPEGWEEPYTGKMGTLTRICPKCGCLNVLEVTKVMSFEEADRFFEEQHRLEAERARRRNGPPQDVQVIVVERKKAIA